MSLKDQANGFNTDNPQPITTTQEVITDSKPAPKAMTQADQVDDILNMVDVSGPNAAYLNNVIFDQFQRGALLLSECRTVPDHYKKDMPACFIALEMSTRIGCNVFALMQHTYVIGGKLAFEAVFIISIINALTERGKGPFADIIQWRYERDDDPQWCEAYARLRSDGNEVKERITIKQAHDWGWFAKNGSAWKKDPKHMLTLRSAAWLLRRYAGQYTMGLYTKEELEDIHNDAPTKAPTPPKPKRKKAEPVDKNADVPAFDKPPNKGGVPPKDADPTPTIVVPKEADPAPKKRVIVDDRTNGRLPFSMDDEPKRKAGDPIAKEKPAKVAALSNTNQATPEALETLIGAASYAGWPATPKALPTVLHEEIGIDIQRLEDLSMGEVQAIMDYIDKKVG